MSGHVDVGQSMDRPELALSRCQFPKVPPMVAFRQGCRCSRCLTFVRAQMTVKRIYGSQLRVPRY